MVFFEINFTYLITNKWFWSNFCIFAPITKKNPLMKWKKLNEQVVYKGWRNMIKKRFALPNGEEAEFDIIGNNAYITVAALTVDQEFILVRQFRPGPEIFLTSFPEGYIDQDESAQEAAKRELLEETGYAAGEVVFLKELRSGYSTETRICLLATDCRKAKEQSLDRTEFIEVKKIPADQFRAFLKDSTVKDFNNVDCGYLALDHLNLL